MRARIAIARAARVGRFAAGAALAVGLAAAAACQGDGKRPGSGQSSGSAGGPAGGAGDAGRAGGAALASCVTRLERAASLPPHERAGVILRGCPLCGPDFDALLALDLAEQGGPTDVPAAWAVVEACGGGCSATSTAALREGLAELGRDHPTIRPWRTFADACPPLMRARGADARFASAAWYALAMIGDRLAAARPTMAADLRARLDAALADLVLSLPPRSASGNPLAVPTGAAQKAAPWLAVSIVGPDLHVGSLPFARLATDGLRQHGPSYPGGVVAIDRLAGAVSSAIAAGPGFALPTPPGRLDRPVIVAAHGAPAARVLDVVRAIGDAPSYLAIASAAPASMWPGQIAAHPVALAARDPVRAPHLRVALTSARVAAVDAAGKVLASAALPSPDAPMAARLYAAAAAMAPGGVIEVVAEDGTVAELAALLDAAMRGGAAGVVPAPPGAAVTGKPRPAFDGPALQALVVPR